MCRFLGLWLTAGIISGALAQPLVISEFMARNSSTLADEDGDFEDWIEIHNPGGEPVDLDGWYVTDRANDLTQWRFPSTNLTAGSYLVVFASGKDRRRPGTPLHTNFKLSGSGEYLALVEPDGKTIASEFSPAYPEQVADVSFGFGNVTEAQMLIAGDAAVRYLVPRDGGLGTTWTLLEFDDSAWAEAVNGLGYETGEPEFVGTSAASAILGKSPLLYLRLDETSGDVAANLGALGEDAQGVYRDGVGLGWAGPRPPAWPGFEPDNRAAHFDGLNDKVDVPYTQALNPRVFSAGCWAQLAGGSGFRSPLTSRGDQPQRGFVFYAAAGGQWQFWSGTGQQAGWTIVNGPPARLSQWTFLVGTYDGSTFRFYVDGVLVGSTSAAYAPNDSNPLRVGGGATEEDAGRYFFNGEVDEVFMVNRALSDTEIRDLYQAALTDRASTNFYYTNVLQTDIQSELYQVNSSIYVRIPFVVTNLEEIVDLKLRARYDDGFIAYINGIEVTSAQAASNAWNASATSRRSPAQAVKYEEFNITDARGALRLGPNVLALHGLNYGATNSDFLLGVELVLERRAGGSRVARYLVPPTPGAFNSQGTATLGPVVTDVGFTPAPPLRPLNDQDITVTARVTQAFADVTEVTLTYRVMFGSLIDVPMWDDGSHGDGAAGDHVYGAVIPAAAAGPGQMVRFKVRAQDALGRVSRWPLFLDPDNSPEYLGTVIADPRVSSELPVWEWFAQNETNARNPTGTRGAVWFNGQFYDNVFIRRRGGFTTVGQKFDFNAGYHCLINDEVGSVEEANLNDQGRDRSYMRPSLAFEILRSAGHPACAAFPVLMRVNGRPDRVATYVEQVDERFLDRWGFDRKGAMYKFVQRSQLTPAFFDATDGIEKKTRLNEGNADLQQIVSGIATNKPIAERGNFLFDNFDLANLINYLAVECLIRDDDNCRKNWYLYRDTLGSHEWHFFPWDKELCLGMIADGMPNLPHPLFGSYAYRKFNPVQWNICWDTVFSDPRTREMYLRRLRTLMDEFLAPVGYLEGRADALFAPAAAHLGPAEAAELQRLKEFFPFAGRNCMSGSRPPTGPPVSMP